MADENTPAFYPRVGKTIAKNFRSAQPAPFIEDPRAMELPFEYADEKPTRERLEMDRRLGVRLADLERQKSADTSPLEKLAGGLQAGRFLGSAMTQGINSIPTRLVHGDKAAEKFMEDRIYKPEQPLAYEYAGDVGNFLEKLETEYKIPPLLPEAVALQFLTGPATSQAMRTAGRGVEQAGRKLESAMEPVVRGALERGGLPREMVLAMGANTQSNVMKQRGGNYLGGEKIMTPERYIERLMTPTFAGETPAQRIPHHEALLTDTFLTPDNRERVQSMLNRTKGEAALDQWAKSNLLNYYKNDLATPNDPVRQFIDKNYADIEAKYAKDQERAARMAERAALEPDPRRKANLTRQAQTMRNDAQSDYQLAMDNVTHLPREDLADVDLNAPYLLAERKREGFPEQGMGVSDPARRYETLTDETLKISRAGDLQRTVDIDSQIQQSTNELHTVVDKINNAWTDFLRGKGLDEQTVITLNKMPTYEKAQNLGMVDELQLAQNKQGQFFQINNSFDANAMRDNPFVSKLDPETKLYTGSMYGLGFDHVMDVLHQDVAEGRIRPEQLNKLSVEQAVRRTAEYNLERAKTMRDAKLIQQEGFTTYKDYPDQGYKWIELAVPEPLLPENYKILPDITNYKNPDNELYSIVDGNGNVLSTGATEAEAKKLFKRKDREQQLADALKYEGDTMGHCVGGYCPDVISGRSKIYSLRDAKGEPHVTIEVVPNQHLDYNTWFNKQPEEVQDRIAQRRKEDKNHNVYEGPEYLAAREALPPKIKQIKGKQNAKPKDAYLPFVQDFVKGGNWSDVGDFKNTGLIREGGQIMTPAEHADWLLKELGADTYNELGLGAKPPPAAGMKRGGKVSISNNPDTMMLEVNNQKMKNGVPAYGAGSAVTKMGLKAAKNEVPRLAMQFGNDLPLNMADDLIKRSPSVDRINMNYKDVTKRVPELTEAAQRLQAGELDRETYAKLVQALKPVKPYDFVPKPATAEEARGALREDARDLYGVPSRTLEAGSPVGLRLDIPAYRDSGVWVPTIHEQDAGFGAGKKIGHESVASVLNPEFGMSEKAALSIAAGKPKGTIATIKGDWNPMSEAEVVSKAQQYLKNPEWRQVGMDPERHSFFYDRETMAPVVNAEEVIQIGPLVLAKNPKFGKLEDFKYQKGGLAHASEPHYGAGALVVKEGLKAAKPAKIDVPIRFPVSRGPTVPEIRAMAERMAPQVMGEFVREAPTASKPNPSANVVGKSKKQFDREQNLQIGYQDIKPPVTPQEFDYAAHKDDLLIGAAGDVTPANRMLHSIDNQPLSHAVHQQGGPEWALYNPSGWAATDEMAKTWMKRADKAADAYNAQPHLHYHKMTPDANWYAMHHLHSLLGHMRPEELKFKNPELYAKMVDEISSKDVGFGKHPEFEGFDDPLNLNIHAQIDPHFRRHLGKVLGSPTFAERYGLNSGVDVMAATSLPDLRNLEVGSSGYAIVPLDTKAPLQHFAADSQTYDTGFPMKGEPKRSKYPSPYELIYRDTLNWMKAHPSENKSSEFGRMNMIVPKQQIDNELIDAIGEYQRRMKELTGKKKGGAVKKPIKKAAGGAITGDDLIIEERPL